ncbi:hypothetical protein LMG1873_02509 [Achromobacter piechaudii]|uniref:Uncharacterized protein n=1 Tax=Achromobacter piechaudii TaxID=72556 RepID=A0ABM8KX15_9BURK|nr:hypothetical protein LMG1873_02509 [Achromobacter piechaudii]CAB3854152.1 hypothetical protein LMG2828_02113 [Achromobacter piechaudii]CAB3950528.1 hypothetical protein LMG6103_02627 [Achromobacter piechaudii]
MAESDLAIRPAHPLLAEFNPAIRPNEKAHHTVRFLLLRRVRVQ